MKKNILILCCGYPYQTDKGFGYHVSKKMEKMNLPENVELLEVGESASMIPAFIADVGKLIVVDYFQTKDKPGTVVRLKIEEVPVTVDGLTDIAKSHFMDTLQHLKVMGQCPETIFIGVVPQDIQTEGLSLTPEIEDKIPKVIEMVFAEIQ